MNVAELWRKGDVGGLITALSDEDSDVRGAAADALGEIGEPAVEPLITALGDKGSDVRERASYALGKIGDPRAVDPLIAALSDKDSEVRWHAADALSEIGDPRAVEPLIGALSDRYWDVRWHAAMALGGIGEPVVELLITALSDKDSDVRGAASYALGKIGDPAVEPLITALSDKDSDVREGAADALGEISAPRAVPALEKAINDSNEDVRRRAEVTLAKIRSSDAYKEHLREDASASIYSIESRIAYLKSSGVKLQETERLLKQSKAELSDNNFEQAKELAEKAKKAVKKIQEENKPKIALEFPEETFKPNTWKRIEITITNRGSMPAKKIKIEPSSDIEFRRIPTIPQLNKNETKTITIGMKPTVMGDVPIDIVITFNDVLDREYTSSEEMWLLVAESMPMSEPILTNEFSPRQGQSEYKYQVALSFAGEDRKYAEGLAELLKEKDISVFYDMYEQADLWGKDNYQHFQLIYRDKAQFCVVFLSHAYAQKFWTRHELESAQATAIPVGSINACGQRADSLYFRKHLYIMQRNTKNNPK